MSEIKFYEFNQHEYYALIGADSTKHAFDLYVDHVAGESLEQVKGEGLPDEISYDKAFNRYSYSAIREGETDVDKIKFTFGDGFGILLIDGYLR